MEEEGVLVLTWKRRISRGFPAFFRQFWLHLRKNLRKNLGWKERTQRSVLAKPGGGGGVARCQGLPDDSPPRHPLVPRGWDRRRA